MKSFTDIEQSKKLAEILPLESADMYWIHVQGKDTPRDFWKVEIIQLGVFRSFSMNIRCWSLAALLDRIPSDIKSNDGSLYTLEIEKCDAEPFPCGLNYHDTWGRGEDICTHYYDNFVDACVEMIIKLKEKGLL